VEATLSQTAIGRLPDVAVFNVPPGVEYGLAFYRDHAVSNYDRNEIPAGDHIVVAAEGSQKALESRLPGRRVIEFGGFAGQHLQFFLIAHGPIMRSP
jgi:hypothetical protein